MGLYQAYVEWRLIAVVKRRMAFDPVVQLLLCRTSTAVVCSTRCDSPEDSHAVEPRGIEPLTSALPARRSPG